MVGVTMLYDMAVQLTPAWWLLSHMTLDTELDTLVVCRATETEVIRRWSAQNLMNFLTLEYTLCRLSDKEVDSLWSINNHVNKAKLQSGMNKYKTKKRHGPSSRITNNNRTKVSERLWTSLNELWLKLKRKISWNDSEVGIEHTRRSWSRKRQIYANSSKRQGNWKTSKSSRDDSFGYWTIFEWQIKSSGGTGQQYYPRNRRWRTNEMEIEESGEFLSHLHEVIIEIELTLNNTRPQKQNGANANSSEQAQSQSASSSARRSIKLPKVELKHRWSD